MKKHHIYQLTLPIIIFLLFCILISCGGLFKTPRHLTLRAGFRKERTEIRNIIETNGYYFCDSDYYSWYCSRNMLFYDDGSFSFFHWKDKDVKYGFRSLSKMTHVEDSIARQPNVNLVENIQPVYYEAWNWERLVGGAYIIDGNRIITETPCLYNSKWAVCRNYFRIVDRQTLKREVWELESDDYSVRFDSIAVFRFIPANNPPDPDYMMAKDKKWMWRDKNEWKEERARRKAKWKGYRKAHNISLWN